MRLKAAVVISLVIGALLVFVTGCAPAASRQVAAPAPSVRSAPSPPGSDSAGQAAAWETQAQRLGKVIFEMEDSIAPVPEARPGTPADGTFGARVLAVDAVRRSIVVDRVQIFSDYNQEVAAARRAHVAMPEAGVLVLNRMPERLTLPVASDAVFLMWYPGARASVIIGPPGVAPRSALTFDEFAALFNDSNSGTKEELSLGQGAWVTVSEGKVTSLDQLVYQ